MPDRQPGTQGVRQNQCESQLGRELARVLGRNYKSKKWRSLYEGQGDEIHSVGRSGSDPIRAGE